MTDTAMWAMIVGFIAPMLISVVTQPSWSSGARVAVLALASVLTGGGTAYFTGQFNGHTVVSSILIGAVAAIAAYHGMYAPTGAAKAIESATSPGGKHRA